jgi:hypothetical protein
MFALIKDDQVARYPYSVTDLKRDNPQVSFPQNMADESLLDFDVYRVYFSSQPDFDASTQRLQEIAPTYNGDAGRWEQVWQVVDKTVEDLSSETSAKAEEVRSERNRLLSESDWTQVLDAPVDQQAWLTYRHALREVPQQSGFPWEVEWPTLPDEAQA